MKPIVFIHANAVQSIAAAVGAYSLKARSGRPETFEVRVLRLEETPHLHRREGHRYISGDYRLFWRNRDAQSHSLLRMMVPRLMGFQGRALVLDPDIFALGDVADLLDRDMNGRAIVCRARPGPDGFPRRYNSSVMLLDCAKLPHWNWEENIDRIFRGELDPFVWLTLEMEPAESIGFLEEKWNDFDTLTADTRLLHNTERITQPWRTGLPIDFDLNYVGAERLARRRFRALARGAIRKLVNPAPRTRVYRQHPDPRQERYFFALLRECLEHGSIDERRLREEIQRGYLRSDAFTLLDAAALSGAAAT